MADKCIVDACRAVWEQSFTAGVLNKNNCSGFVKAVAAELGIHLPNTQADGIADYLDRNWTKLASPAEALTRAGQGYLVLACLKAGEHQPVKSNGHIVVIVQGPVYRNKYPRCWGGSIGGAQSAGTRSVGEVWNNRDRDQIRYYAWNTAICNAG